MCVIVNNIFDISKHVDLLKNGYKNVPKGITNINNDLHIGRNRNKLVTISRCLHSNLILTITTHWSFIDQMKYKYYETTSDLVMGYIRDNIMGEPTMFFQFFGFSLIINSLEYPYTEYY